MTADTIAVGFVGPRARTAGAGMCSPIRASCSPSPSRPTSSELATLVGTFGVCVLMSYPPGCSGSASRLAAPARRQSRCRYLLPTRLAWSRRSCTARALTRTRPPASSPGCSASSPVRPVTLSSRPPTKPGSMRPSPLSPTPTSPSLSSRSSEALSLIAGCSSPATLLGSDCTTTLGPTQSSAM